jgi:hypothetical protein
LVNSIDYDRMRERLAHQRRQFVREVDTGIPADDRLIGFAWRAGLHPRHGASLATAYAQRLGAQFRYLCGSEGAGQDNVPVAGVPVREFIRPLSVGRRGRSHRTMLDLRHESSLTPERRVD